MLNGDFLNKKIADNTGRIEKLANGKMAQAKAIEEIYLVTLARMPKPEELSKAAGWIEKRRKQRWSFRTCCGRF